MKLTPTGYEDHIYTPGQVDIGAVNGLAVGGGAQRRGPWAAARHGQDQVEYYRSATPGKQQ